MHPSLLLITPEYPPARWGGLARTVGRVARALANSGRRVRVLHFFAEDGPAPTLDEHIRTRRDGPVIVHDARLGREFFPQGPSLWDCPHTLTLAMLYETLELIHRREPANLVLSFFLHPASYVAGLFARKAGIPHIGCAVGNDVKKYAFSPEKVGPLRSALDNADRLVFLADDLLDLADALAPVRDKSRVILNSVVVPDPPPPRPAQSGAFTVGAAGIFKHAKGLPYLLKAVARLAASGPVRLPLAGEERPEEVEPTRRLIAELGLGEVVQRLGVIPHDAMPDFYAGLDAFALPSISEGCPNVLMEAMATGVPSVATRVGANERLVEDGVSGLLVDWADPEALFRALDALRTDSALRDRLGREGRERMRLFTPEREAEAWKRLVRETLAS